MSAEMILRFNHDKQLKKSIQEFQGVAASIIYDGAIDNSEINFLQDWILSKSLYLNKFPLVELKNLISKILADRVVTEDERMELFQFLRGFSGLDSTEYLPNIFEINPIIEFANNYFVFTGELSFSERKIAEEKVLERNGFINNRVTLRTNFLIVGSLGSESYTFSNFGHKTKTAIEYNKTGKAKIKIIKESDFVKNILAI